MTALAPNSVLLIDRGKALAGIYVPGEIMAEEKAQRALGKSARDARARLRESVKDLAAYLQKVSGVEVPIFMEPPSAGEARLPILIGRFGAERFGPLHLHSLGDQAFRFLVRRDGLGLYGESDLATSYAIYELLHRLGCRWFMPGELGEEIPTAPSLGLPEMDLSIAPATLYRGLWYADEAFQRRNRLGGLKLAAGHRLERYLSDGDREAHPEWRAIVRGEPHPKRLRWSNPEVAAAIATAMDRALEKRPQESLSISPLDGIDFDESDQDRALDSGDWDPTLNRVSLTDRLLVLANRVAERVNAKHPDLLLGLLAYASYTRPPRRESVHPSIVPVLAPITYCRAHPITDDRCPGARDLREIVTGWGARSKMLAYRSYGYNLAEPSAPNPMLRKWREDLPFVFGNRTAFFQPETLANFETSLPALYLGIRLAWDTKVSADAILEEFFTRFYGHAARQVREYIDVVDRAWTDVPEYSGGNLGYGRRFTPEFLKRARESLNRALAASVTEKEKARVKMLDESLALFELYMKMHWDLRAGRLATLAEDARNWRSRASALSRQYLQNYAFGDAKWSGEDGVYAYYFGRFSDPIYAFADTIARTGVLLTPEPLCKFRFRADTEDQWPLDSVSDPVAQDNEWKTTDVCRETWSTLGYYSYFGTIWYRGEFDVARLGQGGSFAWLSRVDGDVRFWVNGKAVRAVDADGKRLEKSELSLKPIRFDVSGALVAGKRNQFTIAVKRTRVSELGAGGILGPVFFYRSR